MTKATIEAISNGFIVHIESDNPEIRSMKNYCIELKDAVIILEHNLDKANEWLD